MASEHRTSALPSKGFAVVEEKQRQPVDTAQASLPITSESCVGYRHPYITGLYGILAIQSFVWTYLQTFVPAVVSSETSGPAYQVVIRDIFSVLFWNSSFIYNFFIILSMRNAAISFLDKPNGQTFSATIIHRIFRMVIIVCAGSGMATLIYSQIGVGYIDKFKTELPNDSIETPMKTYNGLSAVNSLFNFFWLTSDFYTQAANNFWPTGTLWVSSVIYYESFTTYFLMVILPFTRPRWHLSGLALFALGCFWMQSWGWYSATGLMLADIAMNPEVREEFKQGLKLKGDTRLPYWVFAILSATTGLALKYVFTALPQFKNSMLVLHPFLDLSSSRTTATVATGPYPRVDDCLLIIGIVMAVEMFPMLQHILSSKILVWFGKRTFSFFVAQCIIFWVAGIKLWLTLRRRGNITVAGANALVLATCIPAILISAELFYRLIDDPSRRAAVTAYRWLTT